jgi:putative hydrolase
MMLSEKKPADLPFNKNVAKIFRRFAELLRVQDGNPFRINAYIRAAGTLESLDTDARELLRHDGIEGLIRLPAIGRGLASSIEEIAQTGGLSQLHRLEGTTSPEQLFQTVPGIGPGLSRTIHDSLHIDTLEALETAAHDGTLETVPGIGRRRTEAIRAGLANILRSSRVRAQTLTPGPPVEKVLDVDNEYRDSVQRGKLQKIAPRRFNPEGKAWLPVLHTKRESWHFTALFSNTARAHELGRTDDWVVIYFYDDDHREGQCTVVTETHGAMRGRRMIRGRENECLDHYSHEDAKTRVRERRA